MTNHNANSSKTRKIAHSITEKKRRDSIKHRIQELQMLVPLSAKEENMQQLHVLDNAVKYIKQVQKVLRDNGLLMDAPQSNVHSFSIYMNSPPPEPEILSIASPIKHQNVTSMDFLCQ
ncbi:hypothetical protein HDV06_003018 [Boothiomyces sp. JEL0866]|nr:hypothetical protein HDV06_003018 [Boothiomyces sp. JEL0866]